MLSLAVPIANSLWEWLKFRSRLPIARKISARNTTKSGLPAGCSGTEVLSTCSTRLSCRLRDIQMLFMDTGIGRTAYSIMEQGKLDLILSSRPEDRRAIFEEAAGITKYKAQKKEALRKLEYTDANLVRLADIMKEVKRQIGSLQRQAGKARRYKALFDDLRTLDTHFSRKSHDEIHLAVTAAEKEIDRLRDLQRSLEEQVESQEFGVAEQREQLEPLEEQISERAPTRARTEKSG